MRSFIVGASLAAIGLGTLATGPASAQMYPPDVPVCIQVYMRGGGYTDCRYATIAQCKASASGIGAQCIENPFYVGRPSPGPRRERRVRRDY